MAITIIISSSSMITIISSSNDTTSIDINAALLRDWLLTRGLRRAIIYICIYIYICIEREREMYYIYTYIYICMQRTYAERVTSASRPRY